MKFFLGLALAVFLIGVGWNTYITKGGLIDYCDRNPKSGWAPRILHCLGWGYEMVGGYEKMIQVDKRLVERYPDSPYAESAQFGWALALEKLNHYPEAIEQYEAFLEKYPDSRYATSVRNNTGILRSR
jgi:tetratricopeptide (TPR) repeat protein